MLKVKNQYEDNQERGGFQIQRWIDFKAKKERLRAATARQTSPPPTLGELDDRRRGKNHAAFPAAACRSV